MRPILETYLRRLTNLSGNNRSILIQKLRADHFIEDQLNIPTDGMGAKEINELIKKHDLKYYADSIKRKAEKLPILLKSRIKYFFNKESFYLFDSFHHSFWSTRTVYLQRYPFIVYKYKKKAIYPALKL